MAAILDNYEKMCSAAAHLGPALADLDQGHLQRFSVTWDIAVKRVYQDVVYSDSLVQNNLPIFVSQVNRINVQWHKDVLKRLFDDHILLVG